MTIRLPPSLLALALGAALVAGCASVGAPEEGRAPDAASLAGNWFFRAAMGRAVDSGDLLCLHRGGTFIRIDDSVGRPQHSYGGFLVGDRELVLMPQRGGRQERFELRHQGVYLVLVDERGRERRYERAMRGCDMPRDPQSRGW